MVRWLWLGLAALVTLPGTALILLAHPTFIELERTSPIVPALLLGLAVVGGAFILSWACEVAQLDVPATFALSVLALITVLPEYAVDFSLTYRAGTDEAYRPFAIANMIGANRTIVGFAWPLVILLFLVKFRKRQAYLEPAHRVETGFLLVAGLYSLTIPIKGRIDLFDCVVLVGLFIAFIWRSIKADTEEPHLIGPAAALGQLPRPRRIAAVIAMLVGSAGVILVAAEPFAQSLIKTGTQIGASEVFMVQWFAPLASEAPEIVVTVIFALRGLIASGLGTLVSSKVNQWTLLVGTLPLIFLLGSAGNFTQLPLSGTVRNLHGDIETYSLIAPMLVTSGQTLLAAMILIDLKAGYRSALLLLGLFIAQFLVPHAVTIGDSRIETEWVFGGIYLVLAAALAFRHRSEFVPTFRAMISPAYVRSFKPIPQETRQPEFVEV